MPKTPHSVAVVHLRSLGEEYPNIATGCGRDRLNRIYVEDMKDWLNIL